MSNSRPSPMRRQSSQSSHTSKPSALSPASLGEHQPVRHHVKPGRKTKIVLPRTHGSARNLQKLAQQAQNAHAAEEPRRGSKQRSRESASEIRLPGSLDEHHAQPLRRNFTATHLPRNTSHTKLKKNLSHGQLTKLGVLPPAFRGPTSPGVKSRSKRPKSADMAEVEKDLHEREVELAQQQAARNDAPKKVGFAVGSSDGGSDMEELPQMDGQGLQEDEWTDQSASASPYSTRQNTANNSRRASVVIDKPLDRRAVLNSKELATRHEQQDESTKAARKAEEASDSEEDDEASQDEEHESISARTLPQAVGASKAGPSASVAEIPPETKLPYRSEAQTGKEHVNPATRHLLSRHSSSAAPALVSNVSAVDNVRTTLGSPSASMRSSRSNIQADEEEREEGERMEEDAEEEEEEEEELVSRFMPTSSGGGATPTTPRTGSLHTPESDSLLGGRREGAFGTGFSIGPVSPESARSLPTGGHMPAFSRWRNDQKMLNEKAIAEMEDAAANLPMIPPHVFDRRNESLKSYLNLASLGGDGRGGLSATTGLTIGPELFEGRFKAVNAELKVIQRFHDPIADSMERLSRCKECGFAQLRRSPTAASAKQQLHISKSTTSLPKHSSKLATSTSPPKTASGAKPSMTSVKSATQVKRSDSRGSKVQFSSSQEAPDGREADAIARQLWDSILG